MNRCLFVLAEFRYEAVVVVHKDLDIKNIEKLRGLKSCHTGVGRNVGYKIPITKVIAHLVLACGLWPGIPLKTSKNISEE